MQKSIGSALRRLCISYHKFTAFDYLHVLQPNQHVKNSKPLSKSEKEIIFPVDIYGEFAKKYYEIFDEDSIDIPNEQKFDARYIFADTVETLYKDSCCHLNNMGMVLFGSEIAERFTPFFE